MHYVAIPLSYQRSMVPMVLDHQGFFMVQVWFWTIRESGPQVAHLELHPLIIATLAPNSH